MKKTHAVLHNTIEIESHAYYLLPRTCTSAPPVVNLYLRHPIAGNFHRLD